VRLVLVVLVVAVDHNTHVHIQVVTLLGRVAAVAAVSGYMGKALVVRLLRRVHFKVVMAALVVVMVPLVVTLPVHGPVVLVETTAVAAAVAALTSVTHTGAAVPVAREDRELFVLFGVLVALVGLHRFLQPMLALNFLE
jgi:hypothetical protein